MFRNDTKNKKKNVLTDYLNSDDTPWVIYI